MQIIPIHTLSDLSDLPPARRAVALGLFDGVHIGHRAVISGTLDRGLTSSVFTFSDGARAMPKGAPALLSPENKQTLLAQTGVQELINVDFDCVRFHVAEAVNSYTVAMLVNFLQDECIKRGVSFSQETVFSHPSKIAALEKARSMGFRTYLYFVATDDAAINADRVARRYAQGGHNVPVEKIVQRYVRSLANVQLALPHLSRAYFFDNSGDEMRYLASYADGEGFALQTLESTMPRWFKAVFKVR